MRQSASRHGADTEPPVFTNQDQEHTFNADIEPDADGDGFGDETQDECPTDPSTQGPCPDTDPPETEITKGAPNRLDKAKVKFKFTSDEPDSTFECKLDKKAFKPCSSPKKVKHLDEGKHRFKVVATDAAGNVDASAAKDKFKGRGLAALGRSARLTRSAAGCSFDRKRDEPGGPDARQEGPSGPYQREYRFSSASVSRE